MSLKSRKKSSESPPPALDGFRVLEYAATTRPAKFSGRTYFYVGESEVGRVPRLVIGESLRNREVAIIHATRTWRVIGVQVGFASLRSARRRAERMYPGISKKWVQASVSQREARAFEESLWEPYRCSFCRKTPPQFAGSVIMSRDRKARICHICIREFVSMLEE